jgi:uncharacterized protein YjbJ (UPF0337 family)
VLEEADEDHPAGEVQHRRDDAEDRIRAAVKALGERDQRQGEDRRAAL